MVEQIKFVNSFRLFVLNQPYFSDSKSYTALLCVFV